jgi:nucleoside permease NupC
MHNHSFQVPSVKTCLTISVSVCDFSNLHTIAVDMWSNNLMLPNKREKMEIWLSFESKTMK